ncbi:FAD:protein FMN transferase [Paenibacillus sp. BK720]|uniref:FAD:protein FMN transferase n=1 Tax=Paenibacillus sp. BK720 TaxID=2587092 RepID=UPI001421AE08|nr:FAD:protein FMN transferase [Paenibacillus sp. BK720]NIK69421.1 thiamine biosynthesis lipoprotein [Paenibacillus sp. BK720]
MALHRFRAMNSPFFTKGLHEGAQAMAESWITVVEEKLSRFNPRSELSKLNRSAGQPFPASTLLYEVMAEANRYHEATDGLFNPYMGHDIHRLGYSGTFESLAERPVREEPVFTAKPFDCELPLILDPDTRALTLNAKLAVDLGGFAKGWSAHQLSLMIQHAGVRSGAIGAGGDITLWGVPDEGWSVGIGDPWEASRDLMTLRVRYPAGIATSNTVRRQWKNSSGQSRHHIIHPRTGAPAESDLAQVTLFAPNLADAEVYAKCVLLLGEEQGFDWLAGNHPACAAVGVLHDGSIRTVGAIGQYVEERGLCV